ncbi:hypothetical protein [Acuticoccus sediminis]|uniref:hypothetical protein n=1 Tax=Acuticoccus sediminis TaxID=2184697 RepID=UPI001CFD3DEA|nr:hypothetical protein [Acuticoccus sediminis]
MSWHPMSSADLSAEIDRAIDALSLPERQFWEAIKVEPQKWRCPPWGDAGGGFWVVGLFGQSVIWYNDIEDGFNCSRYTTHGTIGEYTCDQNELQYTVRSLKVLADRSAADL